MRVAIVPEVGTGDSETDSVPLLEHARDPELREQLSFVPENLTAADALGTVLDLGSPLSNRTILVRLRDCEVLEDEMAALLDPEFATAEAEVGEQIEQFLGQARELAQASDLEAASNHYRAADSFLRHEASERRA